MSSYTTYECDRCRTKAVDSLPVEWSNVKIEVRHTTRDHNYGSKEPVMKTERMLCANCMAELLARITEQLPIDVEIHN